MAATNHDHATAFSERLPTGIERQSANQLRTIIASKLRDDTDLELKLATEKGETADITLSPALARALLDVLRLVGSGQGFAVIPVEAELTTQQAADLLNVSRPFLIKLLDEGKIGYKKVGRHRRVPAVDLFNYKAERDDERARILSDMAEEDARLGLI
jgi:excisionase family DNA binding protein